MAERQAGPSDYLAAERTFLAWIRTGLSLMGFGFVVARFGLFLQTLGVARPGLELHTYGPSFWFGTGLILMGVAVHVLRARRYLYLVRDLKRGGSAYERPDSLAMAIAILLAVLGLIMAVYVVSVQEPGQEKSMTSNAENGIVTIPGHGTVEQTVEKLETILKAKGVKLFALVDHSGEAEKAGIGMRPTKLLIFGNPKAGTPLMLASPGVAIDLPLKILVWQDADGGTRVSYNSPAYLQARHGLPPDLMQNIAVVGTLAAKAAE